MSDKWTSGPWTADIADYPETGETAWSVDGEDFPLALLDAPTDENEWNAKLMAAAKELYAACQIAFDALCHVEQYGDADIVAKAMKKARGEE